MINFKALAIMVMTKGFMTTDEFLVLNECAQVSADYNDSLTLNKLTVVFNINNNILH